MNKMKSIRRKLFLGITLILSIFIIGLITYGFTFKTFFIKYKLSDMEEATMKIEEIVNNKNIYDELSNINQITDTYNIQVQIIDETNEIIYANHSYGKGGGGINRFQLIQTILENDNIKKLILRDKSTGADFLTLVKETDAGYSIISKIAISNINESVYKSLELLSIILLPITIVALILTLYYAKSFTKPIIEITKKTSKIERLEFSDSIKINSNDEIGVLANSVNNLSDKIRENLYDLKKKNKDLQKLIKKEKENEIIRKEFVSSVSHELKSPITVISGYSQMLSKDMICNQEDKKYYLKVINDEVNRMDVIVSDLLNLYKLESNTFKIHKEDLDLSLLIKEILEKFQFKFKEANANLKVHIDKSKIYGDRIRIEQAVTNYLNNAISHVDNINGKKIITINVINEEKYVKVSVFNTGSNIDEENQKKIWLGFVRLDKVRNYKEKRVGLGLAIVKQIIKLHDGEYGIDNKDNGVEFWFKLKLIKC